MIDPGINYIGLVKSTCQLLTVSLLTCHYPAQAEAKELPKTWTSEKRSSVWFNDFVSGVGCFTKQSLSDDDQADDDQGCSEEAALISKKGLPSTNASPMEDAPSSILPKISATAWKSALEKHGVDRDYLRKRLDQANSKQGANPVSSLRRNPKANHPSNYQSIVVETPTFSNFTKENRVNPQHMFNEERFQVALHATKLTVHEDYDDITNDNIYMYFITTSDDLVWGKATSIYKGLDEHTSVFLNAEDRGVFSPTGQKSTLPNNHLIVDFGLIESDDEDIDQLKKLSDAIIDLALVATTIASPDAGLAAAQARAEVKNLLRFIVELDTDDRLVTDSLYLNPSNIETTLKDQSYHEIDRVYEAETFWTHFKYGMMFRLLR
jgi:hypothetical protein